MALVVVIALVLAYAMRFEGMPPRLYAKQFLLVLPYLVLLRIGLMVAFGVYRLVWRYVSLRDMPRIVIPWGGHRLCHRGALRGSRDLSGHRVSHQSRVRDGPLWRARRGDGAHGYGHRGGADAVARADRAGKPRGRRGGGQVAPKQRALLIGAGAAGVMVAREVNATAGHGFRGGGFSRRRSGKHGTIIQGLQGARQHRPHGRVAAELDAELAIITIAKAPAKVSAASCEQAEDCGLKVQIIPGLYEILSGRVSISKVRDVAIEDLLGREPVQLDERGHRRLRQRQGRAGHRRGRQHRLRDLSPGVRASAPSSWSCWTRRRTRSFTSTASCAALAGTLDLVPVIGNVSDRERMAQVLRQHRPEVVFHAAAHKHVPLMEANPGEAVRNNVLGTRNMADLAHEHGVEAFVMISTDKAVNPTCVMGATKRVAEMYVQALATQSKTRFITVRFGNVLGSEGSVVPLFKEQIARGGPVTVTAPRDEALLHDHPRGQPAGAAGGLHGRRAARSSSWTWASRCGSSTWPAT